MLYEQIVRRILFAMEPEDAHLRTMRALRVGGAALGVAAPWLRVADPRLRSNVLGLTFPLPVGLAAGLDKHAEAVPAWTRMGAGFVEIGTVTPQPQPGNARPRLFRLPEDHALINRMGFNSVGAEAVARHLRQAGRTSVPVGVNVGKNRDTANDLASADYTTAIRTLAAFADYVVINVSSPNTAGLRDLQRPAAIYDLVRAAVAAATSAGQSRPVLVKISPDLADGELHETVDAVVSAGAGGLIATNTTTSRHGLRGAHALEQGGLSGAPLAAAATRMCRQVCARTAGRLPIIGVGGIFSADDAYARIRAGASLVQIYTALIYDGPGLFGRINRGLLRLLDRDRLASISDAVGLDV